MAAKLLAMFLLLLTLMVRASSALGEEQRASADSPLVAIPSLDVRRYMGKWYEIAKYPNRFQKQCVSNDRAEYTLRNDGRVQVINRCRTANGETDEAVGTARQVGAATSPKFEVRFAPAWLSFIPAVWGDYWVIDLDDAYELVAVSEPKREYLWILSRHPTVPEQKYARLLERLRKQGFDTQKLVPTRQED